MVSAKKDVFLLLYAIEIVFLNQLVFPHGQNIVEDASFNMFSEVYFARACFPDLILELKVLDLNLFYRRVS